MRLLWIVMLSSACGYTPVVSLAQESDDAFHHWPSDLRINGQVILGDEVHDTELIRDVLDQGALSGRVTLLVDSDLGFEELIRYARLFSGASDYRVVKREEAKSFAEIETLLADCTTFLWRSTRPLSDHESAALQQHRGRFDAFLSAGGTVLGLGPAAVYLGETVISRDSQDSPATQATVTEGLGLLADCWIRFSTGEHHSDEMKQWLTARPRTVGIALDRGALLRLSGRVLSLWGDGSATFMIACGDAPSQSHAQTIAQRQSRRQSGNDCLIDLTQWRRRAIDQTLEPFPPAVPDRPNVVGGTLIIVGGGGMPAGLMDRFVEIAGGAAQARLVYVPCSEQAEIRGEPATVRQWKKMGVRHASWIHTKDRNRAHRDESFLAPLKAATGIWFGGGRQWNFADSYYGTKAQRLMHKVVNRGGVVGGSSAGASVQARFLARATPIENARILAPGYERGGLGFLSGVAIDQHFTQRNRQPDMTELVDRYPQLLGIGIDESTALVVAGSIGEVVGKGEVYFYDRDQEVPVGGPDYVKLAAGGRYELALREVMESPTQ